MFERKKILFPGDFNQHFKFGHSAFGCVPKHNGIVQTVKYSLLILYACKCNAFIYYLQNNYKSATFLPCKNGQKPRVIVLDWYPLNYLFKFVC